MNVYNAVKKCSKEEYEHAKKHSLNGHSIGFKCFDVLSVTFCGVTYYKITVYSKKYKISYRKSN
jgi:hypothetical protein